MNDGDDRQKGEVVKKPENNAPLVGEEQGLINYWRLIISAEIKRKSLKTDRFTPSSCQAMDKVTFSSSRCHSRPARMSHFFQLFDI